MKNKKILLLLTSLLIIGCKDNGQGWPCRHEYGELEIINAPTCTENGLGKRVCVKCGYADENVKIRRKGHDFVDDEGSVKPSTCTEVGSKKQICTRCNETQDVEIPITHNFVKVDTVFPDYYHDGYESHLECKICGALANLAGEPTTSDKVKLQKVGDNISISVNYKEKGKFVLLYKDEDEVAWKVENINLKVNDVITISNLDAKNKNYSKITFNASDGNTNNERSKVEGTFIVKLSAKDDGFYVSLI